MNPRKKIFIFLILFSTISAFFIFFIGITFYDKPSISDKLSTLFQLLSMQDLSITDENDNDNFLIISVEEKISSKGVLDLLNFLEKQGTKHIVLDMNFENIQDQEKIADIKELIKKKNNIYGYIKLKESKGLSFRNKNYSNNDKILSNLQLIKTDNDFIYANYLEDLLFINYLQIPPQNVGFVIDTKKTDKRNIDLIYKFDSKYLLSLPFMMSLRENDSLDLNSLFLKGNNVSFADKTLYYDEKGRMSFSGDDIKEAKIVSIMYQEWKTHLELRSSISGAIDRLEEANLVNMKGFELYSKEEEIIDSMYSYPESKDREKNTILTIIKDRSKTWKAFRDTISKVKDATVIITIDEDKGWINNFVYQRLLLKYSENMKRIPLTISLLLAIIIFSVIILFTNIPTKKENYKYIAILLILLLEWLLYFVLRTVFGVVFYASFYFIITLIAIAFYFILAKLSIFIWNKQVLDIYQGNIGKDYNRKIAYLWQTNKFRFSSDKRWISIISVDKTPLMPSEIDIKTSDILAVKNIDIENVIKQNYGIISGSTQKEIFAYFGYPEVVRNFTILKPIKNITKVDSSLNIAIHSSNEYFKFIPDKEMGSYKYFSNVDLILQSMLKYAKEYSVNVIITDVVYKELKKSINVRMLDRINIENIPNYSVRLFELILTNKKEIEEMITYFHAGLKFYEEEDYKRAILYFKQCLKIIPEDIPSIKFLERCKKLIVEKKA